MTNGNDAAYGFSEGAVEGVHDGFIQQGLTKREYFAALAMQGLIARAGGVRLQIASDAVAYADALIEALNK